MKKLSLCALVVLATLALPGVVMADSNRGVARQHGAINPFESGGGLPFVSGNVIGSDAVSVNFLAPFASFCGSVNGGEASNCDTSWTFNYVIPTGQTISTAR